MTFSSGAKQPTAHDGQFAVQVQDPREVTIRVAIQNKNWIGYQHFPSRPKQPFVGLGFADQMVFSAPRGSGWTDSGFRRQIHKVHLGLFLRHWLDLVTRNRYVAFLRLQSMAPRTITCTVCSSMASRLPVQLDPPLSFPKMVKGLPPDFFSTHAFLYPPGAV